MTQPGPVLTSAEQLLALLGRGERVALLDVRWALRTGTSDDDRGRERYLDGHLPGAVFVDLDADLAGPPSTESGRHPLPDPGSLQSAARRWGLRTGDRVVAYDATGNTAAARVWWLLRWAGLTDVTLLDGGLDAWLAVGGELVSGPVAATEGDLCLSSGHLPVVDGDTAAALARNGVLLDARAAARYRGEVEPMDTRAGHIPGAISAPTTDNLGPDGRFQTADALRDRFAVLGVHPGRPTAAYCGSGITAAHEVAALAIAGTAAALYPGSWSQWSADPNRPAAIGPEPG